MKLLILGGGGREHVLAKACAVRKDVEKIYCCPGNAGTALENKCENINLATLDEMADFAEMEKIDLTISGSETYLVEGIVDLFEKRGMKVFGPKKAAAMLEGSKTFAKDFMQKYGVKTAAYRNFTDQKSALSFLSECPYPCVVKADGLAAGKGVIICPDKPAAEKAVREIIEDRVFGKAGSSLVIEEFLEGKEASILSVFDGNTIVPFISAKDHKKIGKGETGLNTGGMGAIAPNPWVTDERYAAFEKDILEPTLKGLKAEGLTFPGIIFFGLMMNDNGVYLLEYNLRLGDPEAQTVLPMMEGDFLGLLEAAMKGKAADFPVSWRDGVSCCVVMASGGYPESYTKGYEISNLDKTDGEVFIAGGSLEGERIITSGGRVLNVVAVGKDLDEARAKAYADVEKIHFKDSVIRPDIGL